MQILRLTVIRDTIHHEGGQPASSLATRVAACAVISNPCTGTASGDLGVLVEAGAVLGEMLAREALAQLPGHAVSYGKAAIVGVDGDLEHAAAVLHPRMGKPMRLAIGGGQAIIPSTQKIGAAGASIDVPLGHKDDVWSFDHMDSIGVRVEGAPRPGEILVVVAFADGGRPRPRIDSNGVVQPV